MCRDHGLNKMGMEIVLMVTGLVTGLASLVAVDVAIDGDDDDDEIEVRLYGLLKAVFLLASCDE